MTTYEATVFVNVDPQGRNFLGYRAEHPLAEVPELPLCVAGDRPIVAADHVFVIGNREGEDKAGRTWPSDVRSVSVGDVIKLRPIPDHDALTCWLAVEAFGFRDLGTEGVPNPIVPLVGSNATSRKLAGQECNHSVLATTAEGTRCVRCGEQISAATS